jgi:hypothetical protein
MLLDPAPFVDSLKATQDWKEPGAPYDRGAEYDLLTTGARTGV